MKLTGGGMLFNLIFLLASCGSSSLTETTKAAPKSPIKIQDRLETVPEYEIEYPEAFSPPQTAEDKESSWSDWWGKAWNSTTELASWTWDALPKEKIEEAAGKIAEAAIDAAADSLIDGMKEDKKPNPKKPNDEKKKETEAKK